MDSVKAFYKKAEIKIVNTLFSLFWIYNYLFVLGKDMGRALIGFDLKLRTINCDRYLGHVLSLPKSLAPSLVFHP